MKKIILIPTFIIITLFTFFLIKPKAYFNMPPNLLEEHQVNYEWLTIDNKKAIMTYPFLTNLKEFIILLNTDKIDTSLAYIGVFDERMDLKYKFNLTQTKTFIYAQLKNEGSYFLRLYLPTLKNEIDNTIINNVYVTDALTLPNLVDTYNQGFNKGYNNGKDVGYTNGYNKGKEESNKQEYENGYESGQKIGYDNGYQIGYNKGYDIGYNVSKPDPNSQANALIGIFPAVIGSLWGVLYDFLSIGFLGINLWDIVLGFASISFLLLLIKTLRG